MTELIKDLLSEKAALVFKLEKVNKAIYSLRELYPDIFSEMQEKDDLLRFKNVATNDLPLRTRIKAILKQQGKFTKVGELARIALSQEPENSPETLATMQAKISRTLTALQKIPETQITKRKISAGATGYAWGFKYWKN